MSSKLPYDVVDDFTPIALLAEANNVLLMSPTLQVKNLQRAACAGEGEAGVHPLLQQRHRLVGPPDLRALRSQAGVTLTHVPYRGTSSSIADISQGNVHLALDAVISGVPLVKQGRVKGLAVSGPRRSPLAPDIPTMGETVPGFSVLSWFGVYGPKGMPPELARRINEEIIKVLSSPEMVARFADPGRRAGQALAR